MLNALSRVRQAFRRRVDSAHPNTPDNKIRTERTESVRHFHEGLTLPEATFFSQRWNLVAVLLASALGLYLEMVMVRWHASCVHTFGVFKNVSMLSCFLGLGIGYVQAGQRRPLRIGCFLPLLAIQCLTFAILSRTRLGRISLNPIAEHAIMWQAQWRWWVEGLGGNLFLAAAFVVNALMFIPLGHLAGSLMARLGKLQAYAINLLGSLLGIGLFLVLSVTWTGPTIWMTLAVLGFIPFAAWFAPEVSPHESTARLALRRALALVSLAAIMASLGLIDHAGVQHYFSPYQTISCQLGSDDKYPCVARLTVNQATYQRILDLSPKAQEREPELQRVARYYDLPYQLKPDMSRVLIVGAGSGNDVAAALRGSALQVTAVEIDPTILFLGERLHPEHPYRDPRVSVVNDDARTFLRRSKETYDLIVYGLLDSHTTLGSLTNVRLDSFVYTVEGFREAALRLKDDGLLVVTFAMLNPQQGRKLFLMLEQAFGGQPPRCFEGGYDGGVMMVTGPSLVRLPSILPNVKEITSRFANPKLVAEVSTDDWPFFYMPRRGYPLTYAIMILVLLVLSTFLITWKVGVPKPATCLFNVFFFLGAGFMLIETKSITQLGLVLGNTWQVLAVVVCSILLLAFLANLWVMWRGPVPSVPAFALLAVSLLAGWLLSHLDSAGWHIPLGRVFTPIVLTLPLFFSGIIFSSELARGGTLTDALSANLFGAMLGGFVEYNSMYWGYASLTWLGLAIYAMALLCVLKPYPTLFGLRFKAGLVAASSSRAGTAATAR